MANLVSRVYSGFAGIDLRGEETAMTRSPDSLNMWKDYKEIDSIRTRPGMALHTSFSSPVRGIFFLNGEMVVHSGDTLYAVANGASTVVGKGLADDDCRGFVYENVLYLMDGRNYYRYNGKNLTLIEDGDSYAPYVPTTTIGRSPSGGGTTLEDVNMLSDWRYNTFLGDGESTRYYLDAENIDPDGVIEVTVDTEKVTAFTVDYEKGVVTMTEAPAAPQTDGQDNVVIKFKKTVAGYKESILGCRLLQVFDNRVFVSGNPEYPNVVWHCSLNDPTYFSDKDYYREGLDEANITGLVAGNNALWVFREPSDANTTVFYHTPTLDADYGKIYPSCHSSITTGCVGKAINFNDDIVFFSERGMEGISGDVTTEQVLGHRSTLVDRGLTSQPGYRDMLLEEWEGYLLVLMGKIVFLADSRSAFSNGSHLEYEWFRWELEREVTCTKVNSGVLYLGTAEGVYTLTDTNISLESWWVTPKDNFSQPNLLKTTNKRGCVVEATGYIGVYAKTESTEFQQVGEYTYVEDYTTCRIKRKKFKDIQLKFASGERFSLERVTLEAFTGGYIKR